MKLPTGSFVSDQWRSVQKQRHQIARESIMHRSATIGSGPTSYKRALSSSVLISILLSCRKLMEDAGLVNVQVVRYRILSRPRWQMIGTRRRANRRLGVSENIRASTWDIFMQIISSRARHGNLSLAAAELDELKTECRETLKEERGRYCFLYVTFGQKP